MHKTRLVTAPSCDLWPKTVVIRKFFFRLVEDHHRLRLEIQRLGNIRWFHAQLHSGSDCWPIDGGELKFWQCRPIRLIWFLHMTRVTNIMSCFYICAVVFNTEQRVLEAPALMSCSSFHQETLTASPSISYSASNRHSIAQVLELRIPLRFWRFCIEVTHWRLQQKLACMANECDGIYC